ncbi:aminodeoxychorismate synthase component I [Alcaligenaceae bacterium]|nr:aminodeoxychorismate synthase component I [Alcaligenaceae bacterium]
MLCRFEDRLSGQALELLDFSHRIGASSAADLPAAFKGIEAAQQQGYWVALLLDYELGEWLEPGVAWPEAVPSFGLPDGDSRPRLTALVYRRARKVGVWPPPAKGQETGLRASPQIEKSRYLGHIENIRASIERGDLYQTNYTQRIKVETTASCLDLYKAIATRHPVAHAAFIEDGTRTVLSFSPELFFARSGSVLTVRPMKGTAPRHADPVLDAQSAQALQHSEKNRAENLMIVDLLRNDLGRIARPGSVKVEALFSLEKYPSVWALTSTITAQAPKKSLEDLLRALFPCGSITGAPKIAAMQKIRELENTRRGIYCGSLGWLAPDGDCSLNVAIRTIEMQDNGTGVFGVGGGIVHDSEPEQEWEECLWKARILE